MGTWNGHLALHNEILDFTQAKDLEPKRVQKTNNVLFSINSIGMDLACRIVLGYIAPLIMNNRDSTTATTGCRVLALYVIDRKESKTITVKKYLKYCHVLIWACIAICHPDPLGKSECSYGEVQQYIFISFNKSFIFKSDSIAEMEQF